MYCVVCLADGVITGSPCDGVITGSPFDGVITGSPCAVLLAFLAGYSVLICYYVMESPYLRMISTHTCTHTYAHTHTHAYIQARKVFVSQIEREARLPSSSHWYILDIPVQTSCCKGICIYEGVWSCG